MKKKIIQLKGRLSLTTDSVNTDQVSTFLNRLISAPDIEAMVVEEDREGMSDFWETCFWSFPFRIVLFSQFLSGQQKWQDTRPFYNSLSPFHLYVKMDVLEGLGVLGNLLQTLETYTLFTLHFPLGSYSYSLPIY